MAHTLLVIGLSTIVAASPSPPASSGTTAAPAGSPTTRYCLRVEPVTGSRIETIQCKTREDWARLDLDVDQEWAQNGVRVIG
jgi:hypothetical protein